MGTRQTSPLSYLLWHVRPVFIKALCPCRPPSKVTAAGLQSNNTTESLHVFQVSATNRKSMQSARENVQSSCMGLVGHWLMALLQLTWKMSAAERATLLRHLANRGSYAPLTLWCGAVVRSRDGRLESRGLTRLEDLRCKCEDLSLAWLTLIRVNNVDLLFGTCDLTL